MNNRKPQVMWVIKDEYGEIIAFGGSRRQALNKTLTTQKFKWITLKRHGWKMVQIEVRETKGRK